MKDDATMKASDSFLQSKDDINRAYRGHVRKARLIINDMTYALALIEQGLGVEEVRNNWRNHIDRIWLGGRAPDTTPREHLLMTIDRAARNYTEPRVAGCWKTTRVRERTFFVTDADGTDHFLCRDLPEVEEAAAEALGVLARFDPELAARISCADIAELVPIWLGRRDNAGRRGKQRVDDALCALVRKLGFGPITPESMRRQRLAWEKQWPKTAKELRTGTKRPALVRSFRAMKA